MFGDPKQVCLPGILILCSFFVSPDSPGRDINIGYACEREGATRYIEVVTEPGFACRVKYTKPALTTFPWNARNDASYCAPRAIGLAEKLGTSGWQCKSIDELSSIPSLEDESSIPSDEEESSLPSVEEVSSLPSLEEESSLPSIEEKSSLPSIEEVSSIPSLEDKSSTPSTGDESSMPSDEEVRTILLAQIERYGRYIESYQVVGKTCYFYPSEAEFGNLCGDEREEAVIVYTCEVDAGGWDQHLAVFHEIEPEPLVTEVGRSGFRQVSTYHIDDKLLMMETEKFALVEDSPSTQFDEEEATILCRYSDASDWELIEQQ
ncbi:MAG: hypothetical protein OES20_02805 [Gammaproteobacteria bacterium]|nr:hypothetical protein [Gammaproteobacteria bacterium]